MRAVLLVRLMSVGVLSLLLSCGGGGSEARPGEGQFVMVQRANIYGEYELYQVRENGGGLLRIEAAADGAEYHAFSQTAGRMVYTRTQRDTFVYQVCDFWPVCHNYDGAVLHDVLYTADSDGSNPVAFNAYPDNQFIDYLSSPWVTKQVFIALTANDRVIYTSNHGGVLSVSVDGSGRVLLPLTGGKGISVNNSGRLIYFSGASLYSIMDDGTGQVLLVDSVNNEVVLHHNRGGEVYYYSRDINGQVNIHRVMEDGGNPTTVASAVCVGGDSCTLAAHGISLGGRLVYSRTYTDVNLVRQTEIDAVKTDASEAPQRLCDTASSGFCSFKAITPNGRVLVSTADPAWPGSGNVYSYSEDGSDNTSPVLIDAISTSDPLKGFTPSGRIIFERYEGHGPGGKQYFDLYTIDDLGQSELPLLVTAGEDDRFAAISQSGRIITERTNNIVKWLEIINEDGSGTTLLATVEFAGLDGLSVAKASTLNGRVIYSSTIFTSPTTSHTDLHSVKEDGTDDVRLAGSQRDEVFAGMF